MFINIDPSDGIPIYEQIVRQIKFAAAGGVVRPGELIPSVREVASELAVNPNTVAKAYRQLQIEGVVESVRGEGAATLRREPRKVSRGARPTGATAVSRCDRRGPT